MLQTHVHIHTQTDIHVYINTLKSLIAHIKRGKIYTHQLIIQMKHM